MIRRDRNRFGGGVVVYIREVHSFKELKDLNFENLEMICCEINKPQNRPTSSFEILLILLKYFSKNVMLKVRSCLSLVT